MFFPMISGSGGSRSRLAKAAGAEVAVHLRNQKLHAAVARSTFASQDEPKHTMFGPLLEVEMSKSCSCCGSKHICKSQCTKHTMFGPFLKFRCPKIARCCGPKHI